MILIVFFSCVFSITIKEVTDKSQTKKFHLDKRTTILTMEHAVDSLLIKNQEDSYCESQQPRVKTETHKMEIMKEGEFKDYAYSEETPLNFGQFIGMVQVRDGFIAITSDAKIYHLKFNYNKIHDIFSFPEYGNANQFSGLIWKVDLQTYAPSAEDKEELPQILYLKTNNLVLVIYPTSAQFFSMYEMDANSKHLILYTASDWIKRIKRGITKEYYGYIYSIVGFEGVDVYRVGSYSVRFELNIDIHKLFPDMVLLADFCVIKLEHDQYHMFMLDIEIGLIELAIQIKDGEFHYEVRPEIPRKQGGIAVDTINGRNVFVVYKELFRYVVIEYLYDKHVEEYQIISQYISHSKVLGIRVTDEFILIQGLIHHQLLFTHGYHSISSGNEPTIYTIYGARDFSFFDKNMTDYIVLKKMNISGYQYDDFFFGVTATGAFLARYNFTPAGVECYSNNETQILNSQTYIVKYNVTQYLGEEINPDIVVRHSFNLTVNMSYQEPILQDELIKTLILVFVLLLVCLLALGCVEKIRQKHENEKFLTQPKSIEMQSHTPFTKISQSAFSEDYKSKLERKKEKKKSQIQSQLL